jgi:glycosyltransferase involved in cell wall biosynthesis
MLHKLGRPLSILNVVLSIGETSGPYNEHCLALADSRDITLCSLFKSDLTPPRQITFFQGNSSVLGFFPTLKAALTAKEYDIIHLHSPHVGLLFLVANLFLLGRFMPRAVYTVQNSYQNYKFRNKLLLLPIFAFFRRVACCSHASSESFPVFYRWLAGDRLCTVQNGPDLDRIDRIIDSNPEKPQTEHFTVASVGRLISIKNPLTVLSAFQQGGDQASRLVFIGEGDWRDSLMRETQARDLGAQVELTGLIPRERVFAHLLNADVCVSASRGEGLPFAVLEAMACRCPVILSDIEPHREIAAGADFIPLIHPDDVNGFAWEIQRLREMPAAQRAAIGEQCRKLVEDRFSLAAMHRQYEAIYAQLLGNHHPVEVSILT